MNILKRFSRKEKITYPLLADEESRVIKAYGIYNQKAKGTRMDGIPHPGTFLIDQKQVIRAKLFMDGYKKRHTSKDIIQAARSLKLTE